jgi:protein-tyrosine phosphatase
VIDLHSHVLPGIDDGPPDVPGSLELARAAVAAGTRVMAATPHVGAMFPVVPEELPGRVAALRDTLEVAAVPLEVVQGGELAASAAADLSLPQLDAITLGGGSCILLECPVVIAGDVMPALVAHLHESGFRVLLAHPERSPEYLRRPERLVALVESGAYVQITAGSLRGQFGRTVRRYSLELLEAGLVHVVASDAHDAYRRSPELRDVVRDAGLAASSSRVLTEDGPRALLDDSPVPRLPGRTRRRPRIWPRRA